MYLLLCLPETANVSIHCGVLVCIDSGISMIVTYAELVDLSN